MGKKTKERLDSLEIRSVDQSEKIAEIEIRIGHQSERIDKFPPRIEALDKSVCFIQRQLDDFNKRLAELSNWSIKAEERLANLELDTTLSELRSRIEKLERRKTGTSEIASLKKQVANHQNILDKSAHPRSEFNLELESRFEHIERRITDLRELGEKSYFNYNDFEKRIEQLEQLAIVEEDDSDTGAKQGGQATTD